MSSIITRSAFRAAPRLQPTPALRRWASAAAEGERDAGKQALKAGAKRDPELYVLLAIMSGVFGLAGWHFSRSPTSASSERSVAKASDSEPWKQGGSSSSPYQYHPGGDTSVKKDAPSALNVVVIPNVTLPKELHDTYNKWGKDGY
ncbi:Nn.00g037990.m01.CDS01 [Neocucurbitaria sp. VM-36]